MRSRSWRASKPRGPLPVQPMIDALTRGLNGAGSLLPAHDFPGAYRLACGWLADGLMASWLFFRRDPSRPRHGRG